MREGQIQDNCTVQVETLVSFGEGGPVSDVSDWIEFGRVKFVKRPIMTTGSMRVAFVDEWALNEEASNYDPVVHFAVPCLSQALRFRTDERGFYTGAKVLFFALGSVPADFQSVIYTLFTGPAIRTA